jgi:cell wall-associated NlpC family hydrolase
VAGLAYGLAYSGSYSALSHWYTALPGYRHAGDRAVPAGGLAFFGGSTYRHVMISIGGGKFASNDINAAGRLSVTTITQIEKRWGMRYLGWSQPWFKANH